MFVQKQETDGELMEAFFFFPPSSSFLHKSELIAVSGDTKLGEQTLTVMLGKLSITDM